MQELAQGSEGPAPRHFNWISQSGVPGGDRSVHEHFCLSKILEVGAEVDQLNLPSLVSFELIGRRLMLIESAHQYNPSNPDYSTAEDYMGWGVQKGAALIAPHLKRHVADRARERASILKETRKHQEELRLRRPARKSDHPKGKGGKGKGEEAEAHA